MPAAPHGTDSAAPSPDMAISRRLFSRAAIDLDLSALTAILALAGVLRLYHLTQRGLIYWDEAKFALEGIRVQSILGSALGAHLAPSFGKAIGTAKPTHALLIAVAYAMFGVHDYAPLLLDAAASVGEVLLTCLLGRLLFSRQVGLIAALLLAVSEYDVIYARSALSESDANLFFLSGVVLWVLARRGQPGQGRRGERRSLLLSGLLLGLSLTTNYRVVVYIGVMVAFDLVWRWREAGLPGSLPRLPFWLLGLAVAPLLWQLAGVAARAHGTVLFLGDVTQRPESYLQELLYQLHEGKQSVVRFQPRIYLEWYLARQGWPGLILLVLGLGLAARRRSFSWLAPAALVLIPYLVYVFAPFVVPRNLTPSLPFASVLSAAALVDALRGVRPRRLAGPLLVLTALLLALMGATMSWRLTALRSGFARAAVYLRQHGSPKALTSSEIMVFYLRGTGAQCNAPAMPLTRAGLSAAVRAGYSYAVLENHHNSPVTDYIRAHASERASYMTLGTSSLGENIIASENSNPPGPDTLQEVVTVFWLRGMQLPPPGDEHLAPCRLDHVT